MPVDAKCQMKCTLAGMPDFSIYEQTKGASDCRSEAELSFLMKVFFNGVVCRRYSTIDLITPDSSSKTKEALLVDNNCIKTSKEC